MISIFWKWFSKVLAAIYVKHRCKALVKSAGFLVEKNASKWNCSVCSGRLDNILMERYIHSISGETFRYPRFVATMCARCAWIGDGESKIPVWRWLERREKNPTGKKFLLEQERASLRLRLKEIENELSPRPRIRFDSHQMLRKGALVLKNRSVPSLKGATKD